MCERDSGEPFWLPQKKIIIMMQEFFKQLNKSDVPRFHYAFIEDEFNSTAPAYEEDNSHKYTSAY
jgi:hypothetical protein